MSQDVIGLILDLSEYEYQKISETWIFELPRSRVVPIEELMKCRYLAFSVDGRWKSIASVNSWKVVLGEGIHIAEISRLSGNVSQLAIEIRSPAGNQWLNGYQSEAVDSAMSDEKVATRPNAIPLCLDLDEAAGAVARRYGVASSQIEISIHRRPQKQPQKTEPGGSKEPE
ncbi:MULTISPECIES: hypothetical protein [Pseudomonas syringae group]|uniref:hypothetical protein n=1 Tax=Pseudomonas syringae group TaxID=136849 RepID=UPI000F051013|nr:hypothetical protein [Pseudomonas viridiflava]